MHGESRRRSQLGEGELVAALQAAGVRQLAGSEEVWVVLDSSDLRKPGAQAMEALMQVRDLEGRLVPGYRVLTALGIAPQARGLLYHRLFSSHEPGFESEPAEVQQAVRSVQGALGKLEPSPEVTWLLDRAFDDEALWGVVWRAGDHLLVRLQHLERSVEAPAGKGRWRRTGWSGTASVCLRWPGYAPK